MLWVFRAALRLPKPIYSIRITTLPTSFLKELDIVFVSMTIRCVLLSFSPLEVRRCMQQKQDVEGLRLMNLGLHLEPCFVFVHFIYFLIDYLLFIIYFSFIFVQCLGLNPFLCVCVCVCFFFGFC